MIKKKRPAKRFAAAAPEPTEARATVGHNATPAYWAEQISATWQKAAESIIETGTLLIEAKAKLKHGQWGGMVASLPFGHSTANKLMAIAEHPVLTKSEHVPNLPPSWGTLHVLTTLPDEALEEMLRDRTINCEMTRDEAVALVREVREGGLYALWRVAESLGVLRKFAGKYPEPASIASRVYDAMVNDEDLPPRYYKHAIGDDGVGAVVRWLGELHVACEQAERDDEEQRQEREDRDELEDLTDLEAAGRTLSDRQRKRLAELQALYPSERKKG